MKIKGKPSLTLLSLLVVVVVGASILDCALCASDKSEKLLVQNVEISPKVASAGESVRVKANLKNIGKNTKNCNAKAVVGESVVEEFKEITIAPGDTIPLMFTLNSGSLNEGSNAVDLVVEESSEQEIFDLGTIEVTPENVEKENVLKGNSIGFNMLYLLPVIPIVAVISFIVWKRRRSNVPEDKMSKDLLPNLLNEVLNFEENVEKGVEKNTDSTSSKSYVC